MTESKRLCIGCHKLYNKDCLMKIKVFKGRLIINPRVYLSGRSSYLCYNMECIDKIKKYRKLEKSFKNKIKITEQTWIFIDKVFKLNERKLSEVSGISEGK